MTGNQSHGAQHRDFPGLSTGLSQRREQHNQIRTDNKLSYLERRRQNRFASLQSNVDLSKNGSRAESTPIRTRNQPPLVVDSKHSFNVVTKLFDVDCLFKRMSTGTRVITNSKEDYARCKNILDTKGFEYHSYESNDDKLLKVFLHGLCKVDLDYLKKDLAENNIVPVQLKEVTTPRTTSDDALYALEFKKTDINLSQLKKVKYICKTAVQWKPHMKRNRGEPTQCSNCLMYGHGGRNCHRITACLTCGSTAHKSQDCPMGSRDPASIIVKCFNCLKKGYTNTSHRANDKNCPCRQEYLNIRAHVRHRNQPLPNPEATAALAYSHENFPAAGPSASININQQPPSGALYSDVLRTAPQESLFNMDELLDIFQNAVEQLQRCTNKMQQMHVIVSLLKHAVK